MSWNHRTVLLAVTLLLHACDPGFGPTGNDVLLQIELDGTGAVTEVLAVVVAPSEVPGHATPRERGELLVEQLDADAVGWSGTSYAPLTVIDEEFLEDSIVGSEIPLERQTVWIALPDEGRESLSMRFSWQGANGEAAVVTELDVEVHRLEDVGGSAEPLVAGDVGATRSALHVCGVAFRCDGPELFCDGEDCKREACLPDDTWDGEVVDLRAGADTTVLVIPLGWSDPEAFEQYVRDLVDTMHVVVDWYAENEGRVGFQVWRQACMWDGGEPDLSVNTGAWDWLQELPEHTQLLPPADRYLVIANTMDAGASNSQGRATIMGTRLTVGVHDSGVRKNAAVLAHELGHSIAALGDEYRGRSDCGPDYRRPNISRADEPAWFCQASDGEVYAGRSCGPSGFLVGAPSNQVDGCGNDLARPCDSSIMNASAAGDQFDPVGVAAMDYALDTGDRLSYEDCGATCDDSCTSIPMGSCGFNDCNNLCDNCDAGENCGMGVSGGGFSCRAECPPGGDDCMSSFGFVFCDGEAAIDSDPMCPGMMLRRVECRDGDLIPLGCVS